MLLVVPRRHVVDDVVVVDTSVLFNLLTPFYACSWATLWSNLPKEKHSMSLEIGDHREPMLQRKVDLRWVHFGMGRGIT